MALLWAACADEKIPEAHYFYFSMLPVVDVSKHYSDEEQNPPKDSAAENTTKQKGVGWP